MSGWLKGGLVGALVLTALWWLSPRPTPSLEADGAVEIHYMAPEGPIKDAMADAVREFEFLSRRRHEKDPSYPIYRVIAGQHASRNQVEDPTRFILSLVGGEPPDVIMFDRFAISEWASRGAFTPLDERLADDKARWKAWQADPEQGLPPWPGAVKEPPRAEGAQPLDTVAPIRRDEYYPACWDEAVYTDPRTGQQGLYGIPMNADNRVLLYNKDILVRNGFVDENGNAQPPRSWEELEKMAVAMTARDADGHIKTIGFIPNYGNSWLYMYGWQAGGSFMSADGKRCTLNDPDIVYALDWMKRVYRELGGTKEVYAFQSSFQGDALDPFILGKVAMKIDGVWVMSSMARFGRDLNVGAAPPPLPEKELAKGRTPLSWTGGWAYAIPATSQQADGAWELIRFLVSRRALEIMSASEEYTYLAQGRPYIPRQMPNRLHNEWLFHRFVEGSRALEPKYKKIMKVFNDMLPHSRFRPVTPVGQKLWNAQIWAMEDALFDKRSPQASLDFYTEQVQNDLDELLSPLPGHRIRNWNWFFWLYGLLIVATIAGVYLWETNADFRKRFKMGGRGGLLKLFGAEEAAGTSVIDGKKGSYFRAQWKEGVVCALPWLIGFVVFTGGPILFSVVMSFCRYDVLNPAIVVGFKNYLTMMSGDILFWKSLYNTVFMVIGIPLGMAVGLGMAILLTQKVRGIAVWRTFFYLPSIVPMVASSILWIWIFNPQSGLINGVLASIGLDGPLWLQDENTSKWALILMGLWTAGGGMIIWIAGLKGISTAYYEAASIDGANGWQQFRYVTLPLLSPYIFFNLIMGLIGTFQIFTQAFIMTAGGPVNSTLFYVYHLFNNAFRYLHMGYAAAMAWFLFAIVIVLTAVQMKLSQHWVHYEGDD